eukprot:611868-Prorocentrum_lima.AAC.1
MRDSTRYEDIAAVEGSRQMRDPSHDARQHLISLAGSARGSHESAFRLPPQLGRQTSTSIIPGRG